MQSNAVSTTQPVTLAKKPAAKNVLNVANFLERDMNNWHQTNKWNNKRIDLPQEPEFKAPR